MEQPELVMKFLTVLGAPLKVSTNLKALPRFFMVPEQNFKGQRTRWTLQIIWRVLTILKTAMKQLKDDL